MPAAAMVISPMQAKVAWNAGSVCPAAPPHSAVKAPSTAPAAATPIPMASICTIESRLLPLLAMSGARSFRVTVFMAVNCSEFTAPNSASCTTRSTHGWSGDVSAKLAITTPTARVLPTNTRR